MKQQFEIRGEKIVREDEVNATLADFGNRAHEYFADKVIEKFDIAPTTSLVRPDDGSDLYTVRYRASGTFNVDVPADAEAISIEL